ncbi:MAG: YeaH/YhbH family protein [Rhodoferax sp.]
MAMHIIDRRLAGKNKSVGNRERFLRRYKEQISEAVRKAVSSRDIRNIEQGESITIPKKDISEPVFHHAQGGIRDTIHPGNKDHMRGDRIARPQGGGGSGSQASDSGEGEDDFVFALSKEEFMQLFFEDLALPHLMRTAIGDNPQWKTHRAGYTHDGTPNNLAVVRSMRGALGRRIALGKADRRLLEEKQARLQELLQLGIDDVPETQQLRLDIAQLEARLQRIPFLDPIDLRFRGRVRVPVPSSKAVMFCLMDVSGSMDQERKDLSKRFFILLYLFLTRHYEKIDIVFIRHHTQAQEVNEDQFFHATESGGTVVSSALVLMHKIMLERYPSSEWNIYGAQASDGDNFTNDSGNCRELLADKILPLVRYFAYVQVAQEEQNLWTEYEQLQEQYSNFAMRKVSDAAEIYPVFRDLFKREGVPA